jgi:hypothetical protein
MMGRSELTKKIPSLLFLLSILLCYSKTFAQEIPRTQDGRPDFQGNWNNLHQTPLQRPASLGDKQSYTAEEADALVNQAEQGITERASPLNPDRLPPVAGSRVTNQADDDFDEFPIGIARINGEYRTSLVIDPQNGRIPLREESKRQDFFSTLLASGRYLDGPEFGWAAERCLIAGPQLSLMFQRGLSPYAQIVQTRNYLMILGEYPYDARIIRIDSEHPVNGFPKWMGDSIAHWEGDTLVIHTNKFRAEHSYPPILSTDLFEVEERLSLTANDKILYQYTVTDPNLYTQAFTAEVPFTRMEAGRVLYEYACHEGNYSWANSLRGARMEEGNTEN